MTALVSVCAWCRPNYAPPGVLVTHTICRAHRDEQLATLGSPDRAAPLAVVSSSHIHTTPPSGEPSSTRRLGRAAVESAHYDSSGSPESGASGSSCSSGGEAGYDGAQATPCKPATAAAVIGVVAPASHEVGSSPARPTSIHLDPSGMDDGTCSRAEFGEDGLTDSDREASDLILVIVGAIIALMGAGLVAYFIWGA